MRWIEIKDDHDRSQRRKLAKRDSGHSFRYVIVSNRDERLVAIERRVGHVYSSCKRSQRHFLRRHGNRYRNHKRPGCSHGIDVHGRNDSWVVQRFGIDHGRDNTCLFQHVKYGRESCVDQCDRRRDAIRYSWRGFRNRTASHGHG